jgi:hypothetical protein
MAGEGVVAQSTLQGIGAQSVNDRIIAVATVKQVVTIATVNVVIASAAVNAVGLIAAVQRVVTLQSIDAVGAAVKAANDVVTRSGLPFGRHSFPLFLKSPTCSFFFVSTDTTG